MRPLENAGKNGWTVADSSGRLRATANWEDRLIVRSASIIYARTDHYATCHSRLHTVEPDYSDARLGWNHTDWGRIVFSDASHFQLYPENYRRCVWRHLGQRAYSAFTIARDTGPQPGVMVWGAISFDSRTFLVVIRGTLAAQRYVDDF
ncbi:transposable element Tc1 transposase [Trichonephila clavipes]|nr:transposable element Tc1 transposase [Trichonephila clavipes]